jgi:hypothetical protein
VLGVAFAMTNQSNPYAACTERSRSIQDDKQPVFKNYNRLSLFNFQIITLPAIATHFIVILRNEVSEATSETTFVLCLA